ncbi:uncharacterized protein G2W53_000627 [Senna tora]|uniref:Uncharacterized protein n=1 Tax=Senna tora TaxID=362788 RepID=A0A835CLT7_9FABA|nr:uncharacterized protein G2W53_000627 [Senna tora]
MGTSTIPDPNYTQPNRPSSSLAHPYITSSNSWNIGFKDALVAKKSRVRLAPPSSS